MCSERRRHLPSPARRPAAAWLPLALGLALGLAAAGCGNKRPPKAPPRIVPVAATDLIVVQRGAEFQFSFAYPAVTIGGLPLPGLEAVELWRLTWPLRPPAPAEDETEEGDGEEAAAGDDETESPEAAAEEPPAAASPFLFRRPSAAPELPAEELVQMDPLEFRALAELEQRIEGAELAASISGDRLLLRLPLGELPPADLPPEEREVELFAVLTVSSRGLPSELSNVVKILPRRPPPAPTLIEPQPDANGINLAWRADDPPVGFRVYRRDAASRVYGEPIAVPAPGARSHLDATASFDSSYVYSVTAVALESPRVESGLATEREVRYEDRYPPLPPAGLIVLAEPGRVRLLWEPSAANDLAGYLVYRRAAEGAGFERLTAEAGLELAYLDETVLSGRQYSYYVSAVDRSGNESAASKTADAEIP